MWNQYPRPQLVRDNWQNLNGEWIVNGKKTYVPSCQTEEELVYEKHFDFKRENERVLLHFQAVDQICKVFLNESYVGKHEGGYLPFGFDISGIVREGDNKLIVFVEDHLDHDYPYGKQRKDRGGMWYTPMSGIWQSVWLEQVPFEYICDVKVRTDLRGADIKMIVSTKSGFLTIDKRVSIENPVLWTPDNPYLYYEKLIFGSDAVTIYFALRTIEIKEINGIKRILLNGEPIFLHGVLDQGYFNPGNMLPESEDEYDKDILRMKNLGFNMLRKHIKIEPEYFYYACDRLGILVMQDIVNSGDYSFFRDTVLGTFGFKLKDNSGLGGKRKTIWIESMKSEIKLLFNHPCIIAYTIFNEGWGQFESDAMYDIAKETDSTRLYDSTSGWFSQEKSDFESLHIYFRLKKLEANSKPLIVSEFGGYSYNVSNNRKNYGYGTCKNREDYIIKVVDSYERMIIPAISKGLCGAIYTQLSDIEDEINGFYSYDRSIQKIDTENMIDVANQIKEEMKKI